MSADFDMTDWPQSLREIAQIIGPGPALRLIDAYSGRDYVYVPETLTEGHALIQAIGETAARRLVEAAPHDRFQIPTLAMRRFLARKRLIRDAEGSTSEIAQRFGVTARWVRLVKSGRRIDPRQIEMFPVGDMAMQKK